MSKPAGNGSQKKQKKNESANVTVRETFQPVLPRLPVLLIRIIIIILFNLSIIKSVAIISGHGSQGASLDTFCLLTAQYGSISLL